MKDANLFENLMEAYERDIEVIGLAIHFPQYYA